MAETAKNDLAIWLNAQVVDEHLGEIVQQLASTCTEIAHIVRNAPLEGNDGALDEINVQGEAQKQLDLITNDLKVKRLEKCSKVAAMVSEEVSDVIQNREADSDADLVVCFDPLDGSSNIETNSAIGTIFSILRLQRGAEPVTEADILQAASFQVTAGYVIYGPSTLLVLTTGRSVAIFALDLVDDSFRLIRDQVTIPQAASEFAINMAYARFWDVAVTTYVEGCIAGEAGPRGKAFNKRWTGSMVADVHRLFVRGGIFIYPSLSKPGGADGKLRFLYEANPMAFLVEVAGGKAMARTETIRSVRPSNLHQRVPVILGSHEEVQVLTDLYGT